MIFKKKTKPLRASMETEKREPAFCEECKYLAESKSSHQAWVCNAPQNLKPNWYSRDAVDWILEPWELNANGYCYYFEKK